MRSLNISSLEMLVALLWLLFRTRSVEEDANQQSTNGLFPRGRVRGSYRPEFSVSSNAVSRERASLRVHPYSYQPRFVGYFLEGQGSLETDEPLPQE